MTYSNNIGIMEMIEFSGKATAEQQNRMDRVVASEDWEEYRRLIKAVLNITLK